MQQGPAPPLNAANRPLDLFFGPEIVRSWRGETSFTIHHPWVVAFALVLIAAFVLVFLLAALAQEVSKKQVGRRRRRPRPIRPELTNCAFL
jgi:hypothetical protein